MSVHYACEVPGNDVRSLLAAVSCVLWGHLSVYDDSLFTHLKQVLAENMLIAKHDSQLNKRWKLHDDIIVNNGGSPSAMSTNVCYHYYCFCCRIQT